MKNGKLKAADVKALVKINERLTALVDTFPDFLASDEETRRVLSHMLDCRSSLRAALRGQKGVRHE